MPYNFVYDLTRLPTKIFQRLVRVAYEKNLHKLAAREAKDLVKALKLEEVTGLNLSDVITLVEDIIEVQTINVLNREAFTKAHKKALLLPHCARKFMDANCKAKFNVETSSYQCQHCSPDCLINKASILAQTKGYDVYVLPGGSCIEKILRKGGYEAVVGVACGYELKMAKELLNRIGVPGQGLMLLKNGCANTTFNLSSLEKIL